MDSRGPDHGADACRYALLHTPAVFEWFDPREIFDRPQPGYLTQAERGLP